MYNISQDFLTAIKQNNRAFKCSVIIGGTTFDDDSIVSMDFDENVNPSDSFMIGEVGSTKLEISIMDLPSNLALQGAQVIPTVSLLCNDNIYGMFTYGQVPYGATYGDIPMGVFNVDDISKNKNVTTLTCYDNMIKLEQAYFSDLTYPASIADVANEICTKAGIELATTLPTTQINKIDGYTYREAIGFIASFLGRFARFNRLGKLEIVTYADSGFSVDGNDYSSFTHSDSAFTIGMLTCKVGDTTLTAGSGGNEIGFENPIMTQDQLNSIYNTLKNLSYMPYSMDWFGNPALQAGDKISITDMDDTTVYATLLMENHMTYKGGFNAEASAVGKTETAQDFSSSGSTHNDVTRLVIDQANIKVLLADKATIGDLTATNANITNLTAQVASINTLLAGNIGASNIAAGTITAGSGIIANGAISSAQIISLDVSKLNAGTISTTKFDIQSDSGYLSMTDNTIQIKDATRTRIQIGKDASNDYNMYVWDASGNLMFDATGLKASGIKDKIIRDDMVSDTANINAAKINIDSLYSQMNGSSDTLKASRIYLDTQAQALDVAFTSLSNTVTSQGNTVSSQGTSINTIQGQISSRIWNTDITTAVNNIQIGGRNLLNTSFIPEAHNATGNDLTITPYTYNGISGYRLTKTTNASWGSFLRWAIIGNTLIDLTSKYSFSIYAVSLNTSGTVGFNCLISNNGSLNVALNTGSQTIGNIGQRYKFEGCSIQSGYDNTKDDTAWHYSINTPCDIFIAQPKLEVGTKCTEYSPAPEDVQSQIDSANTTISTHTSEISQLNNSISLKVDTSTYSAYTNANDSNVSNLQSRMSTAESSISVLQGQIDLKVEQVDIDNAVNSISVGGTNLLMYSAYESLTGTYSRGTYNTLSIDMTDIYNNNNSLKIVASAASINGSQDIWQYIYNNSVVGNDMFLSFYIKGSVATTGWARIGGARNNSNGQVTFNITTNWAKIAINLGTLNDTGQINTAEVIYGFNAAGTFYINSMQLEEGNKPTSWTPAPEDVTAYTDAAKSSAESYASTQASSAQSNAESYTDSEISIVNGNIALKVDKNGVINAINVSTEGVTINASKIDLTGYVTISSLSSSGATTINGDNITTGSISASRIVGGGSDGSLKIYSSQGGLGCTIGGSDQYPIVTTAIQATMFVTEGGESSIDDTCILAPEIISDRYRGYQYPEVMSLGTGPCHIDTTSGYLRLYSSSTSGTDSGIRTYAGETDFIANNAAQAWITSAGAIHGSSKSAITDTLDYGRLITYSDESPDHVFNDRGRGQLDSNGQCIVSLDSKWTEVVNTSKSDYIVSLTGIGTSNVYVDSLQPDYFIVKGDPNKEFFWMVTAERYGFEGLRWNDADLDI